MGQLGSFILEHWLLFLALLIIVGLLFMNAARSRLLGFAEIKTADVVRMMNHDEPVLVDTRSAEEFAGGHILGALNIPHDQLADRLDELEPYRGRKLIVYCRTGQRAAVAAAQLRKAGFESIHKMDGGILAWQSAGLPLVKGDAD